MLSGNFLRQLAALQSKGCSFHYYLYYFGMWYTSTTPFGGPSSSSRRCIGLYTSVPKPCLAECVLGFVEAKQMWKGISDSRISLKNHKSGCFPSAECAALQATASTLRTERATALRVHAVLGMDELSHLLTPGRESWSISSLMI